MSLNCQSSPLPSNFRLKSGPEPTGEAGELKSEVTEAVPEGDTLERSGTSVSLSVDARPSAENSAEVKAQTLIKLSQNAKDPSGEAYSSDILLDSERDVPNLLEGLRVVENYVKGKEAAGEGASEAQLA